MAIQRPSLSKTLIQMELNRFYEKPVARVSAALIFSIVCIAFFGTFAIRPTLQTMAQLIKQIDEKKDIDQKLTQKIAALTTAQRELSQKQSQFALLDIAIPPSPQFTELLTVVEKAAAEQSVVFTSATIQKVPTEREQDFGLTQTDVNLESLPFILTFTGSYERLTSMLRELGNLQRILIVDHFDIIPTSEGTSDELSMSVSVRAFAFAGKNTVPTKPL